MAGSTTGVGGGIHWRGQQRQGLGIDAVAKRAANLAVDEKKNSNGKLNLSPSLEEEE